MLSGLLVNQQPVSSAGEAKVQPDNQRTDSNSMNLFVEILLFVVTLIYSYLEAFVKLFIPVKRKSVSGELVLITGAGHGVGRATAFEFAKRQSRLVLWDISKVTAQRVSWLVRPRGRHWGLIAREGRHTTASTHLLPRSLLQALERGR